MLTTIKTLFQRLVPKFDPLIEGVYADEYGSETQNYIRTQYQKKWTPVVNPETMPHLFDPCAPPRGWRYDPYYELWIETQL